MSKKNKAKNKTGIPEIEEIHPGVEIQGRAGDAIRPNGQILVPVDNDEENWGPLMRHVDVQFKTIEQRKKFQSIFEGLTNKPRSKMKNGKPVESKADAARWIIENLTV